MQTKRKSRQPERHDGNAALAIGLLGANLFGPQRVWSSLLSQREHLLHEIERGRKYLERLRKDPIPGGPLLQTWPADAPAPGTGWMPSPAQTASASSVMEQFLLSWLERLDERLCEVMKEIEQAETHPVLAAFNPEESMLELLRAAG